MQNTELDPARLKKLVDDELDRRLPVAAGPGATLAGAMRYAVLGGGKRVRPILTLVACSTAGGTLDCARVPAAALELIHTYSLVHDDLPSMDDDDVRRGRATVHRAYDEAVAVLVGDALQSLAFEWLAGEPAGDGFAARRAEAVGIVAARIGHAGMVGGQIADVEAEASVPDAERVSWIHTHKTGALFSAAAELGALYGGAPAPARQAFAEFGLALGLAFQITDDVLDEVAPAVRLGKTPGKDSRSAKATYPALYGVERSRRLADERVEQALSRLQAAGVSADPLAALARRAVSRDR